MSNLRDGIRLEIELGSLTEPFTVAQLRRLLMSNGGLIGGQEYDGQFVGTILANHSTGPGNRVGESVRRGGERLFIKHTGRGTYSIDYADYEAEEYGSNDPQGLGERPKRDTSTVTARKPPRGVVPSATPREEIAARFVEHIRNKPFRIAINVAGQLEWYPAEGPVTGWNSRLKAYKWRGARWDKTVQLLGTFTSDLAELECSTVSATAKAVEAARIYTAIRIWGNPKGIRYPGATILSFLESLWQTGLISVVDSTLTKLYALARPNDYAIYDSRVAAAFMTIAEDIYRRRTIGRRVADTVEAVFRRNYVFLGRYNGTGGTRQRGYRLKKWPGAYRVVAAQMEANDLCLRIVNRLNVVKEDARADWGLREIEAVLFMEGY